MVSSSTRTKAVRYGCQILFQQHALRRRSVDLPSFGHSASKFPQPWPLDQCKSHANGLITSQLTQANGVGWLDLRSTRALALTSGSYGKNLAYGKARAVAKTFPSFRIGPSTLKPFDRTDFLGNGLLQLTDELRTGFFFSVATVSCAEDVQAGQLLFAFESAALDAGYRSLRRRVLNLGYHDAACGVS